MSLLLKLIFICTCFYLLGMSTSLPRKSRKPKTVPTRKTTEKLQETTENLQETSENSQETTENPQETCENPQETSENPQETTENPQETSENPLWNFDKQFNCIKNCTTNAFQTCKEAIKTSNMKDGIYLLNILPNKLKPFYGFCYQHTRKSEDWQGWILIQKRVDGSVNFYRDWFDYKYGFGDLFGEFWIGLERLHQMTQSKNYKLWIQFADYELVFKDVFYSTFSVSSEEEGYKLTVGGFDGAIYDFLAYHNGKRFSTFDRDFSESRDFCPNRHMAGWWYGDCAKSNLNGPYLSVSNKNVVDRNIFIYNNGKYWRYSLFYVHMAIHPV